MADTLNQKTLNTRIKLKYDSYENWSTNNPELLAGEVALVYVPADKVAEVGEHNLTGTTPPHVLMKVGDGTSKFNSLKYVSALAADVNSYAKMKATDFEAQVKALANAQVSESIKANADAIDALEALVGTESVTTQIANAIAALNLANTYAAKEHTHTVAEITDLDSTIKGYDYATKGELSDVDAKFADYKKAADQKLIDDEQDRRLGVIEGDYLKAADIANFETKENVKKVADDLAGYIELNDAAIADRYTKSEADNKFAVKGEDTYNDEEVRGLISANAKAIADEEARAKGVEEGLQTQINTIMNNPDAEGAINSINEFTQYINEHGEIAEGFRTDIDKNKEDIAAINNAETGILKQAKDYADGLAGNYAEAEHTHEIADVTGLQDALNEKANDSDLAAIAKSGTTDDLAQGTKVLIFDCGTSAI